MGDWWNIIITPVSTDEMIFEKLTFFFFLQSSQAETNTSKVKVIIFFILLYEMQERTLWQSSLPPLVAEYMILINDTHIFTNIAGLCANLKT